MTRDELEFQISQYLDGTLAEAEQAALEERLAADGEARALLDEYRRLDVALKASPVPAVDWDDLSGRISTAVAEQEEEPAVTYRIGFYRTMAGLAMAAAVLVALGFGIRLLQQSETPRQPSDSVAAKQLIEIVVVDAGPAAVSQASTQPVTIAVGPSSTLQDRPGFAGYHDDIISRPAQVFVARSGQPLQDGSFMP